MTTPTVPEAGPQPVERCDWIEAGQPYPNECGRTLPCDRHMTDHEGHPFGFVNLAETPRTTEERTPRTEAGRNLLGWHDAGHVAFIGDDDVAIDRDELQARIEDIEYEAAAATPSLLRIALEDWLTWWGDDRPEGWEPEQADGCRPKECDCGFLALVHQSRLALGRPCCGEDEHPRVARLSASSEPSKGEVDG